MSANNLIIVKQIEDKWQVSHNDADTGLIEVIGIFSTQEIAIKEANKFEEELMKDGYEVEYGIKVVYQSKNKK